MASFDSISTGRGAAHLNTIVRPAPSSSTREERRICMRVEPEVRDTLQKCMRESFQLCIFHDICSKRPPTLSSRTPPSEGLIACSTNICHRSRHRRFQDHNHPTHRSNTGPGDTRIPQTPRRTRHHWECKSPEYHTPCRSLAAVEGHPGTESLPCSCAASA